jgi:hypothetical protein
MQQATYRPRSGSPTAPANSFFKPLGVVGVLAGELAALASLSITLAGALLIAAAYLL